MLRIHCKSLIKIHRVNKTKRMWWGFPNLKIRPGKIYKLLHECGGTKWSVLEIDEGLWNKQFLSKLKSHIHTHGWNALANIPGVTLYSPVIGKHSTYRSTPTVSGLYVADTHNATSNICPDALYCLEYLQ